MLVSCSITQTTSVLQVCDEMLQREPNVLIYVDIPSFVTSSTQIEESKCNSHRSKVIYAYE